MFTFINPSQMPTYLHTIDFDTWFNKFISLSRGIFGLAINDFQPDLNIEFSDELKSENYGFYDIDEIKEKIRNTWETNRDIEITLDGIKYYSDYRNEYERLAAKITNCNPNTYYDDIRNQIDSWFNNIKFSSSVLGKYINDEKKIILYTRNIEIDTIAGCSNEQNFEKVFVHELFHAYHYRPISRDYDKIELICRCDYTSKVVKESLASAFEWHYCTKNNILGADELKQSWDKHSVFSYPYSGAAHIIEHNYTTYEYSMNRARFLDVFYKSITDMDGALRMLLPEDDFYDIKNAAAIIKKIVKEPVLIAKKTVPQVFVVKNTHSFFIESAKNYLFAHDKNYYIAMKKVQFGDIILHIFENKLHAISIAKGKYYYSKDSHDRHEDGNYIDVAYTIFDTPIDISSLKTHAHYPNKQGDPHYILLSHDLDIVKLIIEMALIKYPNNATLLLINNILF